MELTILRNAYKLMCQARSMAAIYEANRPITKYVHSTSKGHEAIQLATAFHLKPQDYIYPYYRDESMLLGIGLQPYELMLQLLAKADDPFSGGRTYYAHPSLKREGLPKIPHQSSATGMQAIPATGAAHGIKYLESQNLYKTDKNAIVICSLGDGSVTEGEVAEALQMAVLHQLPIVYLVQDNDWGISATGAEMRAMDAYDYAAGFKGLRRMRIQGNDFKKSYLDMGKAIAFVRENRQPILVHATCPLLGHHTSGVRSEWYRHDMDEDTKEDPYPILRRTCIKEGVLATDLAFIEAEATAFIAKEFQKAVNAADPQPQDLFLHEFAPTPITEEKGVRAPAGKEPILMVDAALFAVNEILQNHPEALLFGQDVGKRLGGVFREAATLGAKFGDSRVFNTPIQEAYIVGSTAGFSAVGCKPIVEIQFADYIWPGINQLVTELSKSCYLSMGKYPVASVMRVPTGAYGGGGPYHSGTVESSILPIKGIKIAYPSNAADMKGLMKAAYYDPNPVIMFEHKGLYWSKLPGTETAKTPEPDMDYVLPFGIGNMVKSASNAMLEQGKTAVVVTYGMGVYWALQAAKTLNECVEIIDLRTLAPYDHALIVERVKLHGKALFLTEETLRNSFAEALAGRITMECFNYLDGPIALLGAENLPAIPLNMSQEQIMLPNADKVKIALESLLFN